MKFHHRYLAAGLVCLFMLAGGCASNLPLYPGTGGPSESAMKPYTIEKAEFALPPGWTFEAPDPSKQALTGTTKLLTGKGTVGLLKKDTKGDEIGGSLALFCWGGFISKSSLPEISRNAVTDAMPDAVLVKAYQVDTADTPRPAFEIYSGTMVKNGMKVPMYGYAAWKWTYGFGCKYGISGFSPAVAGASFERDFVAILRSLRN